MSDHRDPIEDLLATAEEPWAPARAGFADELIADLRAAGRSDVSRPALIDVSFEEPSNRRLSGSARWLAAALALVVATAAAVALVVSGDADVDPAAPSSCSALNEVTGDLELLGESGFSLVDRDEIERLRDALVGFAAGAGVETLLDPQVASLQRITGLLTQALLQADAGAEEDAGRTLSAARSEFERTPFCR